MNYKIEAPANTDERNAVAASYDIGRPLIEGMIVHIPDGHKYLAKFQVLSKGKLILPEFGSGERWLSGNGQDVRANLASPITLDGPPYEITLRAYNEDDTYPHAFYLEIV